LKEKDNGWSKIWYEDNIYDIPTNYLSIIEDDEDIETEDDSKEEKVKVRRNSTKNAPDDILFDNNEEFRNIRILRIGLLKKNQILQLIPEYTTFFNIPDNVMITIEKNYYLKEINKLDEEKFNERMKLVTKDLKRISVMTLNIKNENIKKNEVKRNSYNDSLKKTKIIKKKTTKIVKISSEGFMKKNEELDLLTIITKQYFFETMFDHKEVRSIFYEFLNSVKCSEIVKFLENVNEYNLLISPNHKKKKVKYIVYNFINDDCNFNFKF
jgi:hypothetical protein